jgi:hypothetical protein
MDHVIPSFSLRVLKHLIQYIRKEDIGSSKDALFNDLVWLRKGIHVYERICLAPKRGTQHLQNKRYLRRGAVTTDFERGSLGRKLSTLEGCDLPSLLDLPDFLTVHFGR